MFSFGTSIWASVKLNLPKGQIQSSVEGYSGKHMRVFDVIIQFLKIVASQREDQYLNFPL